MIIGLVYLARPRECSARPRTPHRTRRPAAAQARPRARGDPDPDRRHLGPARAATTRSTRRSTCSPTCCSARSRSANRHIAGVADHRARRPAELHRDRGQRRRHADRPGRARVLASGADTEGEFANSAILEHPKLLFLGDVFATPASLPMHNVFSIGDLILMIGVFVLVHTACGSRWSRGASAARRRRHRLMFRAALARRGRAALLRRARPVVPRAPASRCVALPLLAYDRFGTPLGGLRRPAAGAAAGDRARPAARRAGRPRRLAHLRRRRRRPALPRLPRRDDRRTRCR